MLQLELSVGSQNKNN